MFVVMFVVIFVVIFTDGFQALLGRQVALKIAYGRALGTQRESRRNESPGDGMAGINL